jgi:predicted dehydrogenase
MDNTIRVGIIGYGYATKVFHAPLIASVPGLKLQAISSSDAAKVQADWPGLEVCASPQALIQRADIDLVIVPTPNDTHFPLAREALLAGKHVVVDKPFTVTADEARQLAQLAKEAKRVLSVFHNRRWDGDFLTLQDVIATGRLGRIVRIESHFDRFRPIVRDRWREKAGPGSGLWVDLGSHLLDQALQLFGMPTGLHADLATQRDGASTNDCFHAQLRYASGLRVVLHATTLAASPAPRFTVHGTNGSWVKAGLDPQEDALKAGQRPDGRSPWMPPQESATYVLLDDRELDKVRPSPHAVKPGRYTDYYAAVRDAILGAGPIPVTADEALKVMALLELGVKSHEAKRELHVNA